MKHRKVIIRTKISPRLQWVLPYLKKAKQKMPYLIMPSQIRSFKPTKSKIMRSLGTTYFETKVVSLATHDQLLNRSPKRRRKVYRIVALPRIKILENLAHELAHFRYEDHNFEHDGYARMIFKAFEHKIPCPHCGGSGRVIATGEP